MKNQMQSTDQSRIRCKCNFLLLVLLFLQCQSISCFNCCTSAQIRSRSKSKNISIINSIQLPSKKNAVRSGNGIRNNALPLTVLSSSSQPQPQSQRPLFIEGPSRETKPNYEEIDGPLGPIMDKVFLMIFRSKMSEKVGVDSKLPKDDYQGLIELTGALNARFSNRTQVRDIAQDVLRKFMTVVILSSFCLFVLCCAVLFIH
jgi:hypothetical protein